MLLPSILVTAPLYLRYRVYSEQVYPLTISDQRLIDAKVSTVWCQSQVIKANTTFNAYLMDAEPVVQNETVPISMIRQLIMEDDMKEYWGFYLLRGSVVTVSTCVRWPGASLTIIHGHKNLHECAFIGDDSSEELEELLEIANEQGFLDMNGSAQAEHPSNIPEKMTRAGQDVYFHHEGHSLRLNTSTLPGYSHQLGSHELDAQTMRNILSQLLAKTLDTKKKQKENPHHHYEAVFKDITNIDKPPARTPNPKNPESNKMIDRFNQSEETSKTNAKKVKWYLNDMNIFEVKSIKEQEEFETKRVSSAEVFEDVLEKISSLGDRGKKILQKLMDEIDARGVARDNALKRLVNETMNKTLSSTDKQRKRRDLTLKMLHDELMEEDDGDAPLEEGMLHPDGIAEDRGTVNETTLNDRSNSEFWSSFSSSEERLLECKGLILNLPLTPHHYCIPGMESRHSKASFANAVTYRVPLNGYYFFVFNSENEVQPNYVRVQFDLLKTVYNTSNPVYACKNTTKECSLPFKMFSNEKTVLELPLSNNSTQWNEEYIVMSTCEPRTALYTFCVLMVPVLIIIFALQ
ncbi:hypothetical protein X777_13105 [Ooceraea biroi]|uniref:E3 ubiquitin-protein ligase APD1-4 middle domain-containing protein n=1 Tax=Ooceraea biroi TaxID=2015173 RepID=A0A026WYI3_OOCBI|nr:hypothetical protein X777_13105 [Ooceraea biroi]